MKTEDVVKFNKKKQATAKQALLPDPTPRVLLTHFPCDLLPDYLLFQ